jgi:hypothetical protein
MIKVNNKIKILVAAVCCGMFLLLTAFHPYYISVTDIKYKESEKTLQISCRAFTDNIETTLRKVYNKPIDLLHPKDKVIMEKLLANYIINHLKITVNGELQTLNFIGYEKEEEAVWSYFEIKNTSLPKTISVENTLLYEYLPAQINMVHTEVKGNKQSSKVANPEKSLVFKF